MSNHSVVRILVVDDFAPWRRFVIAKLRENRNFRIVGVVADGLDAIQKAAELQPDMILLDIGLPKVTGIVAARRIRNVAPQSKIVFLSQELDLDVAQAALSEGGHGYVVKSDADAELFAAVEAVMQGRKFVSRRLAGPAFAEGVDSPADDGKLFRDEPAASPLLARREVGLCHEVQFYSDGLLALDGFTKFVSAALKAGKTAVVIETESQRHALFQCLQALGPEIRAAIAEGRYVALDSADTLAKFMVDDMPDAPRFSTVVDDLLAEARKRAKAADLRIAACGECASILWAEGRADAAIRLEELWNEVARTHDVDILCGYSLESLRCEEDSYTFRRVCEEHSAVHSW